MKQFRVFATAFFVLLVLAACEHAGNAAEPQVEVWKTPTCGCCAGWVEHLKENGFAVKVHDVQSTAQFRAQLGMPSTYGSCHTAKVGDYVVEGHVPASDIKQLLKNKPQGVIGLAAPGMPLGSPGMEDPRNPSNKPPYEVMLVKSDGQASVFAEH